MCFVVLMAGVYCKDTVAGWRELELARANDSRRREPRPLQSNIPFISPTPANQPPREISLGVIRAALSSLIALAFESVHHGHTRS